MTDAARELLEILYEIDCAERAVRENPFDAMMGLGDLPREARGLAQLNRCIVIGIFDTVINYRHKTR